jgi:hypothetical protein
MSVALGDEAQKRYSEHCHSYALLKKHMHKINCNREVVSTVLKLLSFLILMTVFRLSFILRCTLILKHGFDFVFYSSHLFPA